MSINVSKAILGSVDKSTGEKSVFSSSLKSSSKLRRLDVRVASLSKGNFKTVAHNNWGMVSDK